MLDQGIESILLAVVERADPNGRGPLMVMGLERALDSTAKEHPILHGLNLSRPEWPKKLPRPVVFWLPEYALGIVGREAPDFADWQSGSHFFPDGNSDRVSTEVLDLQPVQGESLSSTARGRRVQELEGRLAATKSSNDRSALAARSEWLSELGLHAHQSGDVSKAITHYTRALRIAEKLPDPGRFASICLSLASVFAEVGTVPQAEILVERALNIQEREGDVKGQADSLTQLGTLSYNQENFERALGFFRRAVELHERSGNRTKVVWALFGLGGVLARLGKNEEAQDIYRKALEVERFNFTLADEAKYFGNLASLAIKRGDFDRAEALNREALEIEKTLGRPLGIASRLASLGAGASRQSRWAESESYLRDALKLFLEIEDPYGQASVLVNLGVVLDAQKNRSAAESAWMSAENLFQRIGLDDRAAEVRSWRLAMPRTQSLPTEPASAGS